MSTRHFERVTPPMRTWLRVAGFLVLPMFAGASTPAQTFDAKGIKLHYSVEGRGQPVVLIHGLHSSATMNWRAPGVISLLSSNYQVIALDLPGHGESDKPTSEAAYGTEMVEDVVGLLDHLNIKRAHIVGYSMGGMIAMKFMAKHQDRALSGIVGGMGWLRDGSALQNVWLRIPERRSGASSVCARSLGKLALTEGELRAIRVPTEIIIGDRDPTKRLYVIPLEQVRKDWPVVEIKDAGHLNCIAKLEFKDAIADWLSKHR